MVVYQTQGCVTSGRVWLGRGTDADILRFVQAPEVMLDGTTSVLPIEAMGLLPAAVMDFYSHPVSSTAACAFRMWPPRTSDVR